MDESENNAIEDIDKWITRFKEHLSNCNNAQITLESNDCLQIINLLSDYKEIKKQYNPQKQYLVDREKIGRPRRILKEEEKKAIEALRKSGKSINDIAKELRLSNRLVMEYCRQM
ncbi:hypothetical protein [Selenomonas ruminantium]|uniref:hypothetical protein n=1 Tax=Selenomonas ruminantium TaxID=971 RepID=UPI0026F146D6|nr:hypothetical protein [Selenomonas ruminantium]